MRPALDDRGELAADRLDLGKLRHGTSPRKSLGRWLAGEPLERASADVGEHAVVAAPAVALEAREQRRVLARVVGVGRGGVAAVIGGQRPACRSSEPPRQPATAASIAAARAWKPATSLR